MNEKCYTVGSARKEFNAFQVQLSRQLHLNFNLNIFFALNCFFTFYLFNLLLQHLPLILSNIVSFKYLFGTSFQHQIFPKSVSRCTHSVNTYILIMNQLGMSGL